MYIGDKEISSVEDTKVIFVDGTSKEFTPKELSYLLTEESKDLTQVRELMLDKVIPEMLQIFEDYNVRKGDIQAILNGVVGSYNETFNIAIGKAFGTFEENKHSAYFAEDIRVTDIKRLNNI